VWDSLVEAAVIRVEEAHKYYELGETRVPQAQATIFDPKGK
jgi:hypothetical protein